MDYDVATNHQLEKSKKRAAVNVRRALTDELRVLYRTMFNRCGRGLTEAQFDDVIQQLHTTGFLTIGLSTRGMKRLELVQPEK